MSSPGQGAKGGPSPQRAKVRVVPQETAGTFLQEMQETWVQSLDREDPLEKEMATHSSILAWRVPWTEEEAGGYSL